MQSPQEPSQPTTFFGQESSTPQTIPILEAKHLLPHELMKAPQYPKMYQELETFMEKRMQRLLGELRTNFEERAEVRQRTLRTYDSRVNNW